jgi:hypothetical protein
MVERPDKRFRSLRAAEFNIIALSGFKALELRFRNRWPFFVNGFAIECITEFYFADA